MIFLGRIAFFVLLLQLLRSEDVIDKQALKQQAHEMFMHGYRSYMQYAWPADELMPLSCKGRFRGVTPSRGDVDDSLGNFSLTLIDTLDTLVVVGELDEFERSVRTIVDTVQLDSDLVVSVFETNIRVLGGLISAHLMAELVRTREPGRLDWYTERQLLKMAIDIGDRLLPAFNTTSGIPYSRINLRHGMMEHLKRQKDTCTACGGTLLLEMAALSRLTGNPVYEEKAKKAMDFLWAQRHRASDLMGTVLNVHSGDWVRRDSGIGAGIDSYYEYCLKAYILLGDLSYLERFNKHYDAVMRYVNKGPLFVDVHMHRPTVATRSFMDALLAFWPGLQVLKGDIKEAIEMHEMLYQVVKKHKFLPEAFTHDFQVHWGEHPLRPEFIESTYFLYRATKDPHYLQVAKQVMDSLNENVRVPCGFAGVKDVRTMAHEDRMDSFVLSETFKYLYMIFSEPEDLTLDPDQYVLTTEAHFLPLSMADKAAENIDMPRRIVLDAAGVKAVEDLQIRHANPVGDSRDIEIDQPRMIRERTKSVLEELAILQLQHNGNSQPQCIKPTERLKAWAFSASNVDHLKQLREMGIDIQVQDDGKLQLSHHGANAATAELARWGFEFMTEMVQLAAKIEKEGTKAPEGVSERYVQLLSYPHLGSPVLVASPALFGRALDDYSVEADVIKAIPFRGCTPLENAKKAFGKVVLFERSDCMFQEKSRHAQVAGAVGVIVIDHQEKSSADTSPLFAMSGDQNFPDDITIPVVFLFRKEGEQLLNQKYPLFVRISSSPFEADSVVISFLKWGPGRSEIAKIEKCASEEGFFVRVEPPGDTVTFQFRFQGVTQDSKPTEHQAIVERHVGNLQDVLDFSTPKNRVAFFNILRTAAYGALGLNVSDEPLAAVFDAVRDMKLHREPPHLHAVLPGDITRVKCQPEKEYFKCKVLE